LAQCAYGTEAEPLETLKKAFEIARSINARAPLESRHTCNFALCTLLLDDGQQKVRPLYERAFTALDVDCGAYSAINDLRLTLKIAESHPNGFLHGLKMKTEEYAIEAYLDRIVATQKSILA
jgi:hypothetical protein